jgi:Ca-activated chloride channel family protein
MTNLYFKTIALLLLVVLIDFAEAQDLSDTPIKVNTLLLNIPVTVSDKNGRYVAGLKKEDFSIYQNGEKQQIEYFLDNEAPMTIAVLLDTSPSTRNVLGDIQKAARDFIRIFRPEDKGIIVSFDFETLFLSELTSDKTKLNKAINQAEITGRGGSNMPDAVYKVIRDYFASIKGRKAIIVLTDGMVWGRLSFEQILDILQKSNTFFYPIIFKTSDQFRITPNLAISSTDSPFKRLEVLAEETAGKLYEKDAGNLKEAFQSIAEELKKQYLLGFYPQNSENWNQLPIKIVVNRKDVTIEAKKRRMLKKPN